LLVLKILPAVPFSEHFLGSHFTKILLSGHVPQKFRLRRRLMFIICFYACPGAPKSKLPRAREDLYLALTFRVVETCGVEPEPQVL
jgi:hypothetical protein